MIEVAGKRIAVIGLSRTGIATATMLNEHGAKVIASDVKSKEELEKTVNILTEKGIEFELGGHGEKCLACDLLVVSPGVPLELPFFKKAAVKGIPIIGEIELAYHFTKASIIAITGTNGKTTTTRLLGNIMEKSMPGQVKVVGNIGVPMIQEVVGLGSDDWIIAEISSFQLETIKEFRPFISLYLNFTPDHLDRHKTIEGYWEAKRRLFMNQRAGDYAIINDDDPAVIRAAEGCKAWKYLISTSNCIARGVYLKDGQLFIRDKDKTGILKESIISVDDIPLRGRHNVMNTAFAIMAAHLAGVDKDDIRQGILNFSAEEHRLQEIAVDDDGTLYIDDSKATNPDAAIKALISFSQPLILIAGGQDRDADFSEFARTVYEKVRVLVLLGETKKKLKEEVLKKGFDNINIHEAVDMKEAVSLAFNELRAGDCLLLSPACPSWDMYLNYKERGREFQREVDLKRGG